MSSPPSLRVFVSYTGKDLEAHADAVSAVVRQLEWVAIDHRYWAPNGRPSVPECRRYDESCHILVVLVAHRYGWVPTKPEGGNGRASITRIEYEHACERGLEILQLIVEDNAVWPPPLIEALDDPTVREPLNDFKRHLLQGLTGFFSTPESIERLLPIPLQKAGDRVRARQAKTITKLVRTVDETIVPYYGSGDSAPTLEERFAASLPKRILSLDGPGIRAGLIVGYLERIERTLQVRYGSPDMRICDYFDLIGGAGAAAIIAAQLAHGATAAEVRRVFERGTAALLGTKKFFGAIRGALYDDTAFKRVLQELYADTTLTDAKLRTGLCIIVTRFDDGRTLSFTNYATSRGLLRSATPLSDLILASTALPTYLHPVMADIGEPQPAPLVSGDVSTGPDPALHLFMVATGQKEGLGWRTGKRRLFMLSLGGGTWRDERSSDRLARPTLLTLIPKIVNVMVEGMRQQSCRLMDTLTYEAHNKDQLLASGLSHNPNAEPMLSYRRIDVVLEESWLQAHNLKEFSADVGRLRAFDTMQPYGRLVELGDAACSHSATKLFLPYFDVRKPVGDIETCER